MAEEKDERLEKSLGLPQTFRIKNTVFDLYPIRLIDWSDAQKLMFLLHFESLAEIAFVERLDDLRLLVRIVARANDLEDTSHLETIEQMTQVDYAEFRKIVMEQNDIDLERLKNTIASISGRPKNAGTPASR